MGSCPFLNGGVYVRVEEKQRGQNGRRVGRETNWYVKKMKNFN